MRNLALLLISLNVRCASLPPFPEVSQCAYSQKFRKFRCVNTKTQAAFDLKLTDPVMEGAQCLSLPDYSASEEWVSAVKQIAEQKCH